MSRQPRGEDAKKLDLKHLANPFACIDFVDNTIGMNSGLASNGNDPGSSSSAMLAAAGIKGGPPAYIDANGIRYVPMATEADVNRNGTRALDDGLTSMSTAVPEPSISREQLSRRVDQRIQQFMDAANTDGGRSMQTKHLTRASSARLNALRDECMSASASATVLNDEEDEADADAISRQIDAMQAEAKARDNRRMANSVGASAARAPLQRRGVAVPTPTRRPVATTMPPPPRANRVADW